MCYLLNKERRFFIEVDFAGANEGGLNNCARRIGSLVDEPLCARGSAHEMASFRLICAVICYHACMHSSGTAAA